jgi:hypothetical protein
MLAAILTAANAFNCTRTEPPKKNKAMILENLEARDHGPSLELANLLF